jgi:hypothetical protein
MSSIIIWYLLVHWGQGLNSIPMQSKDACLKAMKSFDHVYMSVKCLNTETGEVLELK